MTLSEKIKTLAERARTSQGLLATEEATKNALVMPFIQTLGYAVFNPLEVVPEFVADVGTKKGEKVDYAVKKGDEIIMLVDAKKAGEDLDTTHASQLYRYFSVTSARLAILTNGHRYRFFSDLDAPNKMDDAPFLELDLLDYRETSIKQMEKLTKGAFDIEDILGAATKLKNLGQMRRAVEEQLTNPDEELVKYFFSKVNTNGRFVQSVKEEFSGLVKQAFQDIISEKINQRLRSALATEDQLSIQSPGDIAPANDDGDDEEIETTDEELEGFRTVRAIVCGTVSVERVTYRDAKSYFAILVDNNNRKPLCRLHFNRSQKYVGLLDEDKRETRHAIAKIEDLYQYADALRAAALRYAEAA